MNMDEELRAEKSGVASGVNKFRNILKFEALSFIAILFALFFTNGYVYLETLNSRLGVPVSRLGFDGNIYAVYGGVNILVLALALFIAFTAVGVFSALMAFLESPDREKKIPQGRLNSLFNKIEVWAAKRFNNSKELVLASFYVGFVTMVFFLLWELTVSSSIEKAERDAFEFVKDCTVANIYLKNLDVINACIAGESDDAFYLIYKGKEEKGAISFDKSILPKEAVKLARGRASIKLPQ
ncbi:hypothetical protein [Pseudomonas aeruginosa]|uniref:hypothetical protein n=1 Tax=Pseudomonas aeruginosa TaxID=287 RepID=UPI002043DF0F|nr:hypothetical protein [Pseudomonas aeruginosa]MCM3970311.1 hypothetical protein [Pseudomonas aeruginosa]MCM4036970.1 hypothetical protein [Pseudomonas aeruginosa]MCM4054669.1 hypothetical protein [Pseudomonas aeruginosa]